MRYDLNVRENVRNKLKLLAADMSSWETKARITKDEEKQLSAAIISFPHTTRTQGFRIGGVDGSGDYPSFSYADSFVFVASASGALYKTDTVHGLREELCLEEPTLEFLWIPEDQAEARERWLSCLGALSGRDVREVMAESDYRSLKDKVSGGKHSVESLLEALILPRASDTSNVGIQLRSTAELGTALRLINSKIQPQYVLMDTTLSLPLVKNPSQSLYLEHLKRLCCVDARRKGVTFVAISKSHGFPSIEILEGLATQVQGLSHDVQAEHWYIRLPMDKVDGWKFSLAEDRRVPPAGAVSYLFRLHKNTPVMRLDMDRKMWEDHYRDNRQAEQALFVELDYASHDQRAFGYPYPIKAGHDRARLSKAERAALKKQIIDAAVAAGMKRSLFRDVSMTTGHK